METGPEQSPSGKEEYRSFGIFPGTTVYKQCLAVVLILCAFYLFLVGWAIEEYEELVTFFIDEDSVFEYLTVVFFLGAAWFLGKTVKDEWGGNGKDGSGYRRVFLILFAVLFLVIAMEEISWGQRIFGWETTSLFGSNDQGETNVHNTGTSTSHALFWSGSLLLGVVIPLLHHSSGSVRKLLDRFDFPVMSPDLFFFFFLPFMMYFGIPDVITDLPFLMIATCLLLFVFFCHERASGIRNRLPPGWGVWLPLVLLGICIVMYPVQSLHLDINDNKPAQETGELLFAFAYLLFARSENAKIRTENVTEISIGDRKIQGKKEKRHQMTREWTIEKWFAGNPGKEPGSGL